ncbi:unnamed protein product [Protopolystoma xenopodis]|uniref:RGS domain-containing protein n=1 Tax=Protopolystoma xenopodis TaxID=117903 RepID=A0A448WRL8_9PLAT|nr:unnamed protein product [Protopolystoma xenopodis]
MVIQLTESVLESASTMNPWITDNPEYWTTDFRLRDLPIRRVKRWSFSIQELLKDSAGREEFRHWLEKEFSAENLCFWQECQELKGAPLRDVGRRIQAIYAQYLAPNAPDPLNVDSRVADSVRRRVAEASSVSSICLDRYCFEEAEEHIFHLMKSDSYCRFLRSDVYRKLFSGTKKKSKKHRTGVSLGGGTGGPGGGATGGGTGLGNVGITTSLIGSPGSGGTGVLSSGGGGGLSGGITGSAGLGLTQYESVAVSGCGFAAATTAGNLVTGSNGTGGGFVQVVD